QGDVRGFDCYVRAGTYGRADVGLGQGWGVVDAVADHSDDLALRLQAPDFRGLVFGHDFGHDSGNTNLTGDSRRGVAVITGDHDDLHTPLLQGRNGCRRFFFEGVGDPNHTCSLSIHRRQHRGLAITGQTPKVGVELT